MSYSAVPKVESSDVTILWTHDFWDGPKSGMLLFRGDEYWFEVVQESDDPDLKSWYRRFAIIRISPEQSKEHHRRHDLFMEHVAYGQQPRSQWDEYYTAAKTWDPIDMSTNDVVAWFEH